MKILNRKKQDYLLKRIASCQIICNKYIEDIEAATILTEHLADLAIEIGGEYGATKVQNTFRKYERSDIL